MSILSHLLLGVPGLLNANNNLFTYILDGRSTNTRQWSVSRRLNSSYTGPLIRVRRSSDNTQTDIGYTVLGVLDTAALLSFCGVGDGFISVVYSQNGISNDDLTQSITASQPQIVSSGAVLTNGAGRPEARFDGVDDRLDSRAVATYSNSVVQIAIVHRPTDAPFAGGINGHGTPFCYAAASPSNTFVNYFSYSAAALAGCPIGFSAGTANRMGSTQSLWSAGQRLVSTFNSTDNTSNYNSSVVSFTVTSGTGTSTSYTPSSQPALNNIANSPAIVVGATRTSTSGYFVLYKGGISEIVVYETDQAANLEAVRQNQMTYYGV